MIILNDILGYTKQFNKQIKENVIWPKKFNEDENDNKGKNK